MSSMSEDEFQRQPETEPPEPQNGQPEATNTPISTTRPDTNVIVPQYDLLTEGLDPAKLRKK